MARKLIDITDEEAMKIGELFEKKLSPWIVQREGINGEYYPFKKDEEGIRLLSQWYKLKAMDQDGTRYDGVNRKEVLFFSDGEIREPMFATSEQCSIVKEYLNSIGIKEFDFPNQRFKLSIERYKNGN